MATVTALPVFPQDIETEYGRIGVRLHLSEDYLGMAYFRMKSEGLFPVVMHNHPEQTLSEFLAWAKKITVLGFFRVQDLDTEPKLMGLGFINRVQQFGQDRIAEVGEFFFRGIQRSLTVKYCRLALDFCFFTEGYVAVYGVTPVANRAACIFNRRMGFKCTDPLPKLIGWNGKASDGVISSMSREQWEAARESII